MRLCQKFLLLLKTSLNELLCRNFWQRFVGLAQLFAVYHFGFLQFLGQIEWIWKSFRHLFIHLKALNGGGSLRTTKHMISLICVFGIWTDHTHRDLQVIQVCFKALLLVFVRILHIQRRSPQICSKWRILTASCWRWLRHFWPILRLFYLRKTLLVQNKLFCWRGNAVNNLVRWLADCHGIILHLLLLNCCWIVSLVVFYVVIALQLL